MSPETTQNRLSNRERPAARVQTPRFVKSYTDRHGRIRRYYRRKGFPAVPLNGEPGTETFRQAYEAAEEFVRGVRVRPQPGQVYVIGLAGFDLVKIGYTRMAPEKRLRQLENGAGLTGGLELLATVPGNPPHERKLHRRFAKQRLFGEWFRLSGPVADWLSTLS